MFIKFINEPFVFMYVVRDLQRLVLLRKGVLKSALRRALTYLFHVSWVETTIFDIYMMCSCKRFWDDIEESFMNIVLAKAFFEVTYKSFINDFKQILEIFILLKETLSTNNDFYLNEFYTNWMVLFHCSYCTIFYNTCVTVSSFSLLMTNNQCSSTLEEEDLFFLYFLVVTYP